MSQIKSNSIISDDKDFNNPNTSLPRDLKQNNIIGEQIQFIPTQINFPGQTNTPASSLPSLPTDNLSIPNTPIILSVKSQQVNHNPDGSSTVDVVLTVQNIEGVSEYDVRIANAGTL